MKVFIDQSGKVEQTNTATVVAFANGKKGSVILSSRDKRRLQEFYRRIHKPKLFMIHIFCCLVFILIKKYALQKSTIIIDLEYDGQDAKIKYYLVELLRRNKIDISLIDIRFESIGKRNKAHLIANEAYKKKRADVAMKFNQVKEVLWKIIEEL